MFVIFAVTSVCSALALCPGSILERPATGQASIVSGPGNPFIGKWKLNPSRSKGGDEMKVTIAGQNKYTFDFGGNNPETIVLDGTDQAGQFGTMLAVSVEGPNTWRVIRKIGGHTAINATWELSRDGKTLTDHYGAVQADGSIKRTDYTYKRIAGHAGFAGAWENTTQPTTYEIEIEDYEGDGLSFVNTAQKTTKSLKFDGKEYAVKGGNLPAGYVTSEGARARIRYKSSTRSAANRSTRKRLRFRQTGRR
jgi:hypothetical protein